MGTGVAGRAAATGVGGVEVAGSEVGAVAAVGGVAAVGAAPFAGVLAVGDVTALAAVAIGALSAAPGVDDPLPRLVAPGGLAAIVPLAVARIFSDCVPT